MVPLVECECKSVAIVTVVRKLKISRCSWPKSRRHTIEVGEKSMEIECVPDNLRSKLWKLVVRMLIEVVDTRTGIPRGTRGSCEYFSVQTLKPG